MAVYVSVRGWLECDEEGLGKIKEIIRDHDEGHYSGGWAFSENPVNWTRFAFYGGDINEEQIDWLLGQLKEMARLNLVEPDESNIVGLFVATHEVNGISEWQVRDGSLYIQSAAP